MENHSIFEPSSPCYQKYATWGVEFITTLGGRIVTIGSELASSKSLNEAKLNLYGELNRNYQYDRFKAVILDQDKKNIPGITTSLHIDFEGAILPIWPTLHRTHIISNHDMITALLKETRGGKILEFGDSDSFAPIIGIQNMLMCNFEDHRKLRKPFERSFHQKAIHSEAMMSKISLVAKNSIPFDNDIYSWNDSFSKFVTTVIIELFVAGKMDREILSLSKQLLTSEFNKSISEKLFDLIDSKTLNEINEFNMEEKLSSLMLLILAGTVTTYESMVSLMNLLVANDKYRKKIFDEYTTSSMLNSDSEDLLHKFIKRDDTILHYCYLEMLRLSPAIPLIRRKAKEDFNLGDTQVFKGDLLELNIMAAHRDPNIWGDDADQFCPERFKNDPERKKLLKNFSPGKTPCLGKNLAEIEIKMMILLYASRTHHFPIQKDLDVKLEYESRDTIILKSKIRLDCFF